MLSTILLSAVLVSLGGTIVALTLVVLKHKRRASETEKVYEEQSALVLRTLTSSQPIFKELYETIDDIERLSRGTSASADVRAKADEARDIVSGLENIVLLPNIEMGLRIREQYRASHNEP